MSEMKLTNPKDIVGVRKSPMSTVPACVMAEVGVAMLEGSLKYGRFNYRVAGVRASVYYDGTMRHLMDWWEGEDIDPDSGMSHITKAITSLFVLRDAMIQGKMTDDRAPSSKAFYQGLNAKAAEIMDRYSDRSPRHYTIADTRAAPEPETADGFDEGRIDRIAASHGDGEHYATLRDDERCPDCAFGCSVCKEAPGMRAASDRAEKARTQTAYATK